MTTIANTFASKLAVAFVAIAMMFSLAAPAQAQTAEELQAQIDTLMATITALQAQLAGGTSTPATSADAYVFTRSLTDGATGADVTALQNYLISAGFTIPAGATGYYGSQTTAAVAAWQAANGVSPAVGYFGPVSQAKYNMLMAAMDDSSDDSTDDSSDDSTDDPTDVTLSGEASLDSLEIDSASDDEMEEGAENAEVAEVTVEFTDGDAEISRIDVKFVKAGADAADAFDTISLWVDGDKVAEKNADDEDDYQSDEQTMRFSGLDIVAMEDEELEIVVAVNTQNNIDAAELGAWAVSVEALRFFDADGVATTEDSTFGNDFTVTESFTIQVEGTDDEVKVKSNSDDPDATTFQLEDDSKSGWEEVFVFDLDTDDSVNDIEFNTVVLTVDTVGGDYDVLVDDAELIIDGTTIDDVTVTNGNTTTATLTFDVDGDVTVDAGERVAAKLMLKFKALATANEGDTVQGSIAAATTAIIDAEGADDLSNAQLSGSATGEVHTLRTKGISGNAGDVESSVTVVDGATNDQATYTVEVEVTAFEQDAFIALDDTVSTVWALEDAAGVAAVAGAQSVVLSSTADDDGTYFKVDEGETETFTLKVTYIPGAVTTDARLQLTSISFNETAATPNQIWAAEPDEDYRTDVETIVD